MAMPACLLLAEDDPVSAAFLSEALEGPRYRVDLVADGRAALRAASDTRYDLLLLDLNLPHLAAHQVLPRLRGDPVALSSTTPAMVLTADDDATLHAALRATGFVNVLAKPVAVVALRDAVDAALGHGHRREAPRTSPAPPSMLDWDDGIALAAANGNPDIVRALRPLMLAELPAQFERTLHALERHDRSVVAAELHRLRAACGFCGAARLARAVDVLARAISGDGDIDAARTAFADAASQLLATPLPAD
jgi:DNA-binding response OmpR family regulator